MSDIQHLSKELAAKAKKELNESPKRIETNLQAIRHWLKMSPHIKCRDDDQFLVAFFRYCKYSLETVKDKLEVYYLTLTKNYQAALYIDPYHDKILEIIRKGSGLPLNLHDHTGVPVVVLIQIGLCDIKKISPVDFFEYTWKFMATIIDNDQLSIAGLITIVDFQHAKFEHALHFTPTIVSQGLKIQQAIPVRIKTIHILNVPGAFLKVFNLTKSMLSDKLQKRIIVHKSLNELHKHVKKEILPQEWGGDAGPMKEKVFKWEQYLISKQQLIVDCANYGVDETKLRTQSKGSAIGCDSVVGSFQNLSFD